MQLVKREQLLQDLKTAFKKIPKGPVLLHSDLSKVGFTYPPHEREKILQDYEDLLAASLGTRTLILPTFNYQFCKDGLYDRQNSPSQVGVLSDYYRKKYPDERTKTPIFNFVIKNRAEISLEAAYDVFGQNSTFNSLKDLEGSVVFLGADFSSVTYLHHVEEQCSVGYRYLKAFKGELMDEGTNTSLEVIYRVRPLDPPHVVEYDWPRLIEDLLHLDILKVFDLGHGKLQWFDVKTLNEFWIAKLYLDEFYLLTQASKEAVKALVNTKGYPFQFSSFEE